MATIPVDGEPAHVAFGDDSLWLTTYDKDALLRIGAGTSSVAARVELPASQEACWLGAGEGAVWVSNFTDNRLADRRGDELGRGDDSRRPQPDGDRVHTGRSLGDEPLTTTGQHLLRIDPATNRIVGDLKLEGAAQGARVAVGAGSVWVGRAKSVVQVAPEG